jgi:uncharacterized protein (TIGR02145 family)
MIKSFSDKPMIIKSNISKLLSFLSLTLWGRFGGGYLKLLGVTIISCTLFLLFACEKEKVETKPETGTVKDVDGNVYQTVKIGNQWWMAENLNVKRYRNGDSISYMGDAYEQTFDSAKWLKSDSGAWCKGRIDYLYNGYAALDQRNIAPEGWHIPTDEDWKQLEKHIGMSQSEIDKVNWRGTKEANKLRLSANPFWNKSPDLYEIWGTNESGFTALPNGCVVVSARTDPFGLPKVSARYSAFGEMSFWWSSSLEGNQMWYRYLDQNKGGVFRYFGPMNYGFSIRCVKD